MSLFAVRDAPVRAGPVPAAGLAAGGPVRVLLCDDSVVARGAMSRLLATDPGISVIGKVGDGQQALTLLRAMAPAERPQVVLLDLEMPVMDGMTALPLLLAAAPGTAVIVASALSQRGARATMEALRAGAVDYIPKTSAAAGGMHDALFKADLIAKVKGWARMRQPRPTQPAGGAAAPAALRAAPPVAARAAGPAQRPRIIAIGSSTGGPQALATLVAGLTRPLAVPVVAVQHMPAGFTALLAEHLDRLGPTRCHEAQDGQKLLPGHFYLAPGDRHLLVRETPQGLVAQVTQDAPENFCRPAVDPMLRSLVATCKGRVLIAILTGMGQDGLLGCKAAVAAGAQVLAQDEASSVVWGMPGAVAKAGLAAATTTLDDIAGRILAAGGGSAAP
jgi:two-component system chemotaxis response regulator CheB